MQPMNLDQKLHQKMYREIWQQYCGFLDLSLSEYMAIQERLMLEQIALYAKCPLGRKIMDGAAPQTLDEFRAVVPLTTYSDYADILLEKREELLPAKPVIWIETTWEGGHHPIKTAPYTQSMIDHHRGSIISTMLLATSDRRGRFSLRSRDSFLFGMAPLPYFTGIIPYAIEGELTLRFMPEVNTAQKMSFGERNKTGFKLGLLNDIDIFFGMSGVVARMSEMFPDMVGGKGKKSSTLQMLKKAKPHMLYRLMRARAKVNAEGGEIYPKDLWHPKALMCGGTDSACFKKKIEYYWGVRPLEIFGGTEPTCIATETWSKDGMVFFPDVCFYEFIPEREMLKNLENPDFKPRTFLMDELVAGEKYELVISNFKGGAFMRYRVGDVFRCKRIINEADGIRFPQFEYVDRVPNVIDIAGFTRITENTIRKAITVSGVQIHDWFAAKRYDSDSRPYMQLYVEMSEAAILTGVVAADVIRDHLSAYFKYIDVDYSDLKKMLGIDPLVVTVIETGTIERYEESHRRRIRRMNPPHYDVVEIERLARLR